MVVAMMRTFVPALIAVGRATLMPQATLALENTVGASNSPFAVAGSQHVSPQDPRPSPAARLGRGATQAEGIIRPGHCC
jgi:hypothetical protein